MNSVENKIFQKLKVSLDTKKYKKYLESISILLLGIITSFSLPPYNYWFINFFTFSLLFTILIKNKKESLNFFCS